MPARLALIPLIAALLTASASPLAACGDKFLSLASGSRFQRAVVRQPAHVLLFAKPASPLEAAVGALGVPAALTGAGYTTTTVSSEAALAAALAAGPIDLVVLDLGDRAAMDARLTLPNAPAVLAVAYDATRVELDRAKKAKQAVVKSPTRCLTILGAIDDALARRRSAAGTGH